MGLSQIQVLAGAVIGAFIVSVLLYYLLIKFTPLSWIILGYKNSWLQPFKKKHDLKWCCQLNKNSHRIASTA